MLAKSLNPAIRKMLPLWLRRWLNIPPEWSYIVCPFCDFVGNKDGVNITEHLQEKHNPPPLNERGFWKYGCERMAEPTPKEQK